MKLYYAEYLYLGRLRAILLSEYPEGKARKRYRMVKEMEEQDFGMTVEEAREAYGS